MTDSPELSRLRAHALAYARRPNAVDQQTAADITWAVERLERDGPIAKLARAMGDELTMYGKPAEPFRALIAALMAERTVEDRQWWERHLAERGA